MSKQTACTSQEGRFNLKPMVVRPGVNRSDYPAIRLSPDESLKYARDMRQVLGWVTEALDREGKAIPGTETWVINAPWLIDTYSQMAEFGWGNGAIFPEYESLAHACRINWRQAIRRVHALESIGLIIKRPDRRADGSPSSNMYGLIHPFKALRAKAICLRLPKQDPETGARHEIIPIGRSVDVNTLPPFPTGQEAKARVVFIKPSADETAQAEAAAAGEEPGLGNMVLPPWWAVRIAQQEGINSIYLQCKGYDVLRWLEATRQLRDPKHPGKALRGIYRNLRMEAKMDQVAEEKLLTGRSLTAEEEIRERFSKMVQLAVKGFMLGESPAQIRQRLKSNPPELVPLRECTDIAQHEIDQAIEEGSRLLKTLVDEQERLRQMTEAQPLPADVVKWVRAVIHGINTQDGLKRYRTSSVPALTETLWTNRELWEAPASLTRKVLEAALEAIRLQE